MSHQEQAYAIMVAHLQPTWIEDGRGKMRPKAVRLRNAIAKALADAWEQGVKAEHHPAHAS